MASKHGFELAADQINTAAMYMQQHLNIHKIETRGEIQSK